MATQSSILALDRGAWQATVHGVAKSWTRQKKAKKQTCQSCHPMLQLLTLQSQI